MRMNMKKKKMRMIMRILPITRRKQLSPNNSWRLTPNKRLGILLKHVLLFVSPSKYSIPAPFYIEMSF